MMLLTMDLEIQRNLAHLSANDMLKELKALYSKQAEQELLQTMKSYINQLERLGHLSLCNLENYNMHSMGKTVNELHAMLKLHEETLPKKVVAHALHAIRAGKVQKNKNKKPSKAVKGVQGKVKSKKAYANAEPSYATKPKIPPPPKKDNPAKDAICHHCGEVVVLKSVILLRDGLYEIEMSCSNTNDSSMYAVSNKRAKLNLDSSLLRHCRLGHINKKSIEKLQHDGLLNWKGLKMARKPYSHQVERAKDLL
ncbi:zinc finger, CCHC-type containing protein [Tanacetum coccineum]